MEYRKNNFIEVLTGNKPDQIPFWFMRQAGRYLPEYRDLRSKSDGFLDMAYNPDKACEITLQPVRRFGMDAAIIFSDILVVPHALGQHLEFVEGVGPKLNPLRSGRDIASLKFTKFAETLNPVYEAISKTRTALDVEGHDNTALIGFSGAPWTLACYMIEGGGSKDFLETRKFSYAQENDFRELIDLLVESVSEHLMMQIKAGAQAVQIFDSWAGVLDAQSFRKWVIEPTQKIIKTVRTAYPNVPIIGFPKGAGQNYFTYIQETEVTALGLDSSVNTEWAARALQHHVPIQGNLDPICLLAGGDALILAAEKIIGDLKTGGFIFNLGHGIHKDTPVEHVEMLVNLIREQG